MATWLAQAANEGQYRTVNITGGEPFNHWEELLAAITAIKRAGFMPTVVTSAVWAKDSTLVAGKLGALAEAGLRWIAVSIDDYHQRRIPLQQVGLVLDIARALDIGIGLSVTTGPNMSSIDEQLSRLKEFVKQETLASVEISSNSLIFAGRANRLSIRRETRLPQGAMICSAVGPVIHEDGVVSACCGPDLPLTSPLVLGNLHFDRFSTIAGRFRRHLLIPLIKVLGIRRMAQIAVESGFKEFTLFVDSPDPEICNVCMALLARPEVVRSLERMAQLPEVRREIAVRALIEHGDPSLLVDPATSAQVNL